MATQGVATNLSKTDISDAITKCHGQLRETSRELKISHDTLYNYLKIYPELDELIDNLRRTYTRTQKRKRVEMALNRFDKILEDEESKPDHVIKVGMYYLDNLGKDEGFKEIIDEKQINQEKQSQEVDRMIKGYRESSSLSIADNINKTE